MDQRLAARAQERGGYFSRRDVLDAGYGDRDIRAALKAHEWSRLRAGAYAPAETYDKLDAAAKHRVLTTAVLDKLGPHVVASHVSAVVTHDIAVWGMDLSVVHVNRLDGGAGRREHGIVHHVGAIDPTRDLVEVGGRLSTSPARSVWELSALVAQDRALVSMDSGLNRRRFVRDDVERLKRRFGDWQGARRPSIVIRLCDGLAESPGESLSRFLCYRFGLPRPTLQYQVVDEAGTHHGSLSLTSRCNAW